MSRKELVVQSVVAKAVQLTNSWRNPYCRLLTHTPLSVLRVLSKRHWLHNSAFRWDQIIKKKKWERKKNLIRHFEMSINIYLLSKEQHRLFALRCEDRPAERMRKHVGWVALFYVEIMGIFLILNIPWTTIETRRETRTGVWGRRSLKQWERGF